MIDSLVIDRGFDERQRPLSISRGSNFSSLPERSIVDATKDARQLDLDQKTSPLVHRGNNPKVVDDDGEAKGDYTEEVLTTKLGVSGSLEAVIQWLNPERLRM